MADVSKGDKVSWKNAGATAHGEVTAVSAEKVTKTIKGKSITRDGTKDDPAVTVKSDNGGTALHRAHELKKG